MSETIRTEVDKIKHIQDNPWLYDSSLTEEEVMYWKLRGICHQCHVDPHYHRDDCIFSANQQMLAGLTSGNYTLDTYTMQLYTNKK